MIQPNKVIELGAHIRMSVADVIALIAREEWVDIIVCGYHKDNCEIVVRSSSMTREQALWIVESARQHTLGQ